MQGENVDNKTLLLSEIKYKEESSSLIRTGRTTQQEEQEKHEEEKGKNNEKILKSNNNNNEQTVQKVIPTIRRLSITDFADYDDYFQTTSESKMTIVSSSPPSLPPPPPPELCDDNEDNISPTIESLTAPSDFTQKEKEKSDGETGEISHDNNNDNDNEKNNDEDEDHVSHNTNIRSKKKQQRHSSWLLGFVTQLSSWLIGEAEKEEEEKRRRRRSNSDNSDSESEESELWKEWEWIVSEAEKLAMKRSQEEAQATREELRRLRANANLLKSRPLFLRNARRVMRKKLETLTEQDKVLLESTELDAPKRSAIITKVVEANATIWLAYVKDSFFERKKSIILGHNVINKATLALYTHLFDYSDSHHNDNNNNNNNNENKSSPKNNVNITIHEKEKEEKEEKEKEEDINKKMERQEQECKKIDQLWDAFEESYNESTYRKGLVGALKEVGWQASHGPGGTGLTYHILGDITWAFWKTFNSALRWSLENELPPPQDLELLAEEICMCQESIVDLWFTTCKNSELGKSNEGHLPKIWAAEDLVEKKRLEEIKKKGANARYEYKPVTIKPTERKQKLHELRALLESKLDFSVNM